MKQLTVALAGNPNVGKSTIFNALTGLHQHTGNWPGKTVALAEGSLRAGDCSVHLVDLPGTYSLTAGSPEEVVARDYLLSGAADVTLAVADATCLCRNLNLILQIRQITSRLVVCVNLLDEAEKDGLEIDLAALSRLLSCPVVGAAAGRGRGLAELMRAIIAQAEYTAPPGAWRVPYPAPVEKALALLPCPRYRALALLCGELAPQPEETAALSRALDSLGSLTGRDLRDAVTAARVQLAEEMGASCLRFQKPPHRRDRLLDRLLAGRLVGIPAMLLLLGAVFYLTIWGSSAPSEFLQGALFSLLEPLRGGLASLGAPPWLQGLVADGLYRTTAWVVAVMLPPMAIFFPLFTLLEDAGLLPRIAFACDRFFRAAGGSGRQSLTMCMGLGCNACGVMGCRIIDSPRERLAAILTNAFIPCNGRLPTLILLSLLLWSGTGGSLAAAGTFLTCLLLAVVMTLLATRLLTATVLRGQSSAFTLELPPYRMPRLGQVLVRSLLDRTLFVLGRAVTVAAPAGLVIWTLANVTAGGVSLLSHAAAFFDPLGRLMGLDGMVLTALLLGFPANEIVLPALLMGYLHTGSLVETGGTAALGQLLAAQGWTAETAVCMMVLCVLHFPCGTTCLTIRRETGSWRWTALAALLPTAMGMALCMAIHGAWTLLT